MAPTRISILGAGAWGTALAHAFAEANNEVTLWGRSAKTIKEISNLSTNSVYLGNLTLSKGIRVTTNIEIACCADIVLLVVPTQSIKSLSKRISKLITPKVKIICCAKGFEQSSGNLLSEVLSNIFFSNSIAYLSGPTFASELVERTPTAATLAAKDITTGKNLAEVLSTETFRLYSSTDIIGAQVGGATKNVIAIASGIAKGQGFGENTRAALITRGLAEMVRLTERLGGAPTTLYGLSGLGDLLLSCSSGKSRNFLFGESIGKNQQKTAALDNMNGVVEGWFSTTAITKKAIDLNLELPICFAVNEILHKNANINEVIGELLRRPIREE